MKRRLQRLLTGLLLAVFVMAARANEVAVLVPAHSALTNAFVSALRQALPTHQVTALTPDQQLAQSAEIVITMGRNRLAWRQRNPAPQPTIATYIPLESAPDASSLGPNVHVLLANPAPARQVALAKLLLPGAGRLGVLISQSKAGQLPAWTEAASNAQRTLNAVTIPDNGNLSRSLADVIVDSDVLLGTDDSTIYNADNLKTILLTSYSRNKVLIGPSAPFIEAGSLSTTYSSPEDMARSAAHLITQGLPAEALSYPRYFSVLSNTQVARSLGIPLPDDATLARRLAELEQEP